MVPRKVYLDYWRIDQKSYWEKIEFIEKRKEEIRLLEFEDRNEIELNYLSAIFEIGKYEKYLGLIDDYIEQALEENTELFILLLTKKAAAKFSIGETSEAKHISCQILAIEFENKLGRSILRHCIRKKESPNYQAIRAISNFLLLMSALSIAICWLLIAPFHPQHLVLATAFVKTLVTTAFVTLIINELFYQLRGQKEWDKILRKLREKHAIKSKNK